MDEKREGGGLFLKNNCVSKCYITPYRVGRLGVATQSGARGELSIFFAFSLHLYVIIQVGEKQILFLVSHN